MNPVNYHAKLTLVSRDKGIIGMETPSRGFKRCLACAEKALAGGKVVSWTHCQACTNLYMQLYRDKNRARYNEYQREWRAKHRDKLRKKFVENRRSKIAKMTAEELVAFRKYEANKVKAQSAIIKDQVFTAYGGWICNCCGEQERAFLTIDHMLNDGYKLRKEKVHGHSTRFYRWLKNNGYPKDFQVLCMNCNFGKRMNNGVCPHKQGVTTMAQASRGKCPEAQGNLKRFVR